MKDRKTVWRGCPNDDGFTQRRCHAYDSKTGQLCLQPASLIDSERGCYVCEKHAKQLVFDLTVEACGFNPK